MKRCLLLDVLGNGDIQDYVKIWHTIMGEDLVLAPQSQQDCILIVLSDKRDGVEKLAEWIENPDDTFDKFPLFVIWDNRNHETVQMYAPFDNGVRQLVAEYK